MHEMMYAIAYEKATGIPKSPLAIQAIVSASRV
jgi:hypothetical protein